MVGERGHQRGRKLPRAGQEVADLFVAERERALDDLERGALVGARLGRQR